jgi:hypothetical protein
MLSWRGGAFAVALLLCGGALGSVAGCHLSGGATPVVGGQPDRDASVYEECDSICIRPSDCAQAYNDDGICPPGFLCSLRFTCASPTD